jgi:hypothetical protein
MSGGTPEYLMTALAAIARAGAGRVSLRDAQEGLGVEATLRRYDDGVSPEVVANARPKALRLLKPTSRATSRIDCSGSARSAIALRIRACNR